jgi:Cd(II)/Pb(II)-responsive transcriptional regulator
MKIGEVAKKSGCPVETIRYYEREKLLPVPLRTHGNYRVYRASDVERLSFIRDCRSLDMTLEEVGALLGFRDAPEKYCTNVNRLLDEHIGHVAQRIAELRALEEQLAKLRRLCRKTQKAKDCGILMRLGKGGVGRQAAAGVHRRSGS